MYLIGTYLSILVSLIFQLIQDLIFDSDWFLYNLLELELFYFCSTVFVQLYAYFCLHTLSTRPIIIVLTNGFDSIDFHQLNSTRNVTHLLM